MIQQSGTQFLQNMRDFTVQIRDPATQAIMGTGVALDMEGQVITCAHVLRNALGIDPRLDRESPIEIYFPKADEADGREWIAQVKAYFPQHDDDIVLLQIAGGKSPLKRLIGGEEARAVHVNVKGYYQDVSPRNLPRFPTLDDLAPLIELVHHACQAGAYDEANQICW